jgi:hypothetical protein
MLLILGCSGRKHLSCGNEAVLPWPDSGGNSYSLQTISFSTLSSLYKLRGPAAEIYFEAQLDDHGFQGSVAEPHLSGAGSTCVPQDVGSSAVLSAYAQFERLYDFERRLGTDTQVSWPRKVGVETYLIGDFESTHNNAHYYGPQDVMAIVPFTPTDHLPVQFNLGIIAHEHFHAHFQHEVFDRVKSFKSEDVQSFDVQSKNGINSFTIRAWNEGLADFFAAVYMQRPDSFVSSLNVPERNLALTPRKMMYTAGQMAKEAKTQVTQNNMTGFAYTQGTVLGQVLWRLAHSGVESPEAFLARILKNLHGLATLIDPAYRTQALLDVDAALPVLLEGYSPSASDCEALKQVVTSAATKKGIAACAF